MIFNIYRDPRLHQSECCLVGLMQVKPSLYKDNPFRTYFVLQLILHILRAVIQLESNA